MKKAIAILFALCLGGSLLAAAVGSSESAAKAVSIPSATSVTLVEEDDGGDWGGGGGWDDWDSGDDWDDDFGDDDWMSASTWSDGVYYLSTTLKKGRAYSVWIDGGSASDITFDAYAYDTFESESSPSASFSSVEEQVDESGVKHYICWLKAEDWESDDPSSWKYIIGLSGEVGLKTTVYVEEGEKSFLPEGVEGNPKRLTFADKETTFAGSITDTGAYYFQAELEAGRKYFVRTTGGTAADPFALKVETAQEYKVEDDSAYATDKSNAAYVLYPQTTGRFVFVVSGKAGAAFGLAYRAVPVRSIGNHPAEAIAAGEAKSFQPGRVVADAAYYDGIIDEKLFRLTAAAGERWVLDAKGADRPVEMRLYDDDGEVLATNGTVGDGTHDVRIVFDADSASAYYVGVCDPSLAQTGKVVCATTTLTAKRATAEEDVAVPLAPCACFASSDPIKDGTSVGPCVLNASRWTRTFSLGVRKDIAYKIKAAFVGAETELSLSATVFKYSGGAEVVVDGLADVDLTPGANEAQLKFTALENATYYIRMRVTEGMGLDYPEFNVYSLGYTMSEEQLGSLTVQIKGAASATWTLDKESVKYAGGQSVIVSGEHTVSFSKVTGLNTPESETVTVKAGKEATVVAGTYTDTYDPDDDTYGGATVLKISAKEATQAHTLWGKDATGKVADAADWFYFSTKEGVYNNFELLGLEGDAVMRVYPESGRKPAADPVAVSADGAIRQLALDTGSYYLCVTHGTEEAADSSYTLATSSANVGAIRFAKEVVSVKKNAGSVELAVKRTAKEGRVRVKYATVAGTALPGERYVAQSGILEWEDGDGAAQYIEIKLIPDLVAVYKGDTQFQVVMEPIPAAERDADEYPAQVTADTCTVTVKETASKSVTTVEDAYAKSVIKPASVKTEDVSLRSGTFFGVLAEDGSALTNGLPKLASVTLSVSAKDAVSAKVALAGKSYAFKSDETSQWADAGDGYKRIVLTSDGDELTITVKDGQTTDDGAWLNAGGQAELTIDVPDAKGNGVQEDIRYIGEIFRQNAKVDDYLQAVAETFAGYYTLALVPEGVTTADGIPAGNGYLTVKVDNKGTATVAGLLADGTKVSAKVVAAAIRKDATSKNGHAMYLPVYQAKSPYCFGGTIKLTAKAGTTLPDLDYVRVVDSTVSLVWNNDNASLTYYNEDGWRISCSPVGGWYDKVVNLEAYYLNHALSVGTADITEFPTEALSDGYEYTTAVQPNGQKVAFVNDVLSADKRVLVKDGKLYDLVGSVNPCNVQVKFARATGIVSGSFSLWSENSSGAQKEVKGAKHNGVVLLSRDDFGSLDGNAVSAGFCSATVSVSNGGKSRKWTYSLPFNVLGVDQGEGDAWAQDKGWNPDWGENPSK